MLSNQAKLVRGLHQNFAIFFRHQSSLADKKIGLIGIGHVGNAVTKNLLSKNFKVSSIYDINKSQCDGFGVKVAKTPREVMEESDIVITALPKPPDVLKAFEGEDGFLAGLSKGKIWIDHSTTDYEQNENMNEKVSAKGAFLLEAPITGGLEALKKGQMTVFIAGEKDVAEQMRPVMRASFGNILYTGPLGTALIPKIYSNMLCCVHLLAAAEVLMVAKRAKLDMKTFWDCIRASAGNSFVWETGCPMVFQGTYDPSFTLDLYNKDNNLGYQIAKKYRVPIDLLSHAQQNFHRAQYQYGDGASCYSPPKMLEESLGVSLRMQEFNDWSYSVDNLDGTAVVRHHGIKLTQDE